MQNGIKSDGNCQKKWRFRASCAIIYNIAQISVKIYTECAKTLGKTLGKSYIPV